MKIKLIKANNKLKGLETKVGGKVYAFSLLSGWSCPFAKECYAKAVKTDAGYRIQDGPDMQFRCYSASEEVRLPSVFKSRNDNFEALKSCGNNVDKMAAMIQAALPKKVAYIRIHAAGDFFTKNYFLAWVKVAHNNPKIVFYAYTKSLPFWVYARDNGLLPNNLILTASYGGTHDHLISQENLRYTKVVESVADAKALGLPIDKNDIAAALPSRRNISFALLIHGPQQAGSLWGKAVKLLKGVGSYGPKSKS